MASIFRRKITKKVINCIHIFLSSEENAILHGMIPRSIKFCRKESYDQPTSFELAWKDLIDLKPDLAERVHPDSFYTVLRNQSFSEHDGILGVSVENDSSKSYKFTVDQNNFNQSVLHSIHDGIDDVCNQSIYFIPEPPESVLVEYSSPNIAKPFHYGHFRSTILGNFISNLFSYAGHKVVRLNYVGDWGLQYGILATGFSEFGSREKLDQEPLLHLYEVYREANIRNLDDPEFSRRAKQHFQELEEGNEDAIKQWKFFREISLQKMNETYQRLGIEFTETHGESMYADKTEAVLQELVNKSGACYENDGSVQTTIKQENLPEEKMVLKKSDGTSLYLSRDLAAAIHRKQKYHFDSMFYVVDSTQSKHFSALFSLIKALGHPWYKDIYHVPFGRILNFSTRKGNVVFLHDILNEAMERCLESMMSSPTTKVQENMEAVAEVLGVSALMVGVLSCRRKKDYSFDWDKILTMKGDSGISLQYCHARLNNIKENCGVELKKDCNFSLLREPQAIGLIDVLSRFDEALYNSYKELEPYILVHYLFELRHAVGKANKVLTVKGQPLDVATARLLLFHCSQLVLQTGLKILGVKPLNKM